MTNTSPNHLTLDLNQGPKLFFDSSAWLLYFHDQHELASSVIDQEGPVFTSILSLYELRRKLIRASFPLEDISRLLDFMKTRAVLTDIDETLCEDAALLSHNENLHMSDALIYASACRIHAHLLTSDADFRGKKNVLMLE